MTTTSATWHHKGNRLVRTLKPDQVDTVIRKPKSNPNRAAIERIANELARGNLSEYVQRNFDRIKGMQNEPARQMVSEALRYDVPMADLGAAWAHENMRRHSRHCIVCGAMLTRRRSEDRVKFSRRECCGPKCSKQIIKAKGIAHARNVS